VALGRHRIDALATIFLPTAIRPAAPVAGNRNVHLAAFSVAAVALATIG
jgi:hypothetical protein